MHVSEPLNLTVFYLLVTIL